jgi:hypothetical protein
MVNGQWSMVNEARLILSFPFCFEIYEIASYSPFTIDHSPKIAAPL